MDDKMMTFLTEGGFRMLDALETINVFKTNFFQMHAEIIKSKTDWGDFIPDIASIKQKSSPAPRNDYWFSTSIDIKNKSKVRRISLFISWWEGYTVIGVQFEDNERTIENIKPVTNNSIIVKNSYGATQFTIRPENVASLDYFRDFNLLINELLRYF